VALRIAAESVNAKSNPNGVSEIVGDYSQVVAVVIDVGGQEPAVSPAQNDLLAAVRGLPIHFHVQLVGFDQPGRLGQPFPHLRQEEQKSMSSRPVAGERRIGLHREPPLDGAPDQGQRWWAVPALGRQR
jgi:hypothetical protein